MPVPHSSAAGQSFILTLPETTDKNAISQWLEQTKPAGVMLLAFHVKEREQTKSLTTFLQREAKRLKIPPLIVAIDWEGGIVSRPTGLTSGFHPIPSPWLLAKLGRQACFQAGLLIGKQMRDVGITMDFAPSLDLFGKMILATRCFAANTQTVATCGIAFAKGLMLAGVVPVIKHFPGLGLGEGDTHDEQIAISAKEDVYNQQVEPFKKALQAGVPAIMATHGIYEQFGNMPVTRSKQAVAFLRENNPNALLITDDFMMKAAFADTTQEAAIHEALEAGYDYIILSAKPAEQITLVNRCKQKSLTARKKCLLKPQPICAFDENRLANQLATTCLQSTFIPPLQQKKLILITTDIARIRPPETWFIQDEKSYLHKALSTQGGVVIDEFILDPKSEETIAQIMDILALLKRDPETVILVQTCFYANAPWNGIQKEWLNTLKPLAKRMVLISLGHPEEQALLPDATTVTLGSFHPPLLNALARRLICPIDQGIDTLAKNPSAYLAGKRFGLLCNNSSLTNQQLFLPDVLFSWAKEQTDGSKLMALFSPEHGLRGNVEAFGNVETEDSSPWQCPVYSLHGKHKQPTASMLKNLDTLIIALPDVGMRCYTYLATIDLTLEACSKNNVDVILLNSINPIAHWGRQGPNLDLQYRSLAGRTPMALIHGQDHKQLAATMNKQHKASLTFLDHSKIDSSSPQGFYFTPPSPNFMTIDHLYAYGMTVLLEGTNYSEGRGTRSPFLQCGAPWVDARALAAKLNQLGLAGVYFEPISFTPQAMPGFAEKPKHEGNLCHGVFIHILDHKIAQPIAIAESLIKELFTSYPKESGFIKWGKTYFLDNLYGCNSLRSELEAIITQP
jgi:uncharacterized protein YbbC (DUF1343 family)/beta-glucosidase-like glycosyl hydrolase